MIDENENLPEESLSEETFAEAQALADEPKLADETKDEPTEEIQVEDVAAELVERRHSSQHSDSPTMGEDEDLDASTDIEEVIVPAAAKDKPPELSAEELDAHRASLPWYVVHTYSGYETRAKLSLEERVRSAGIQSKFGNIIVPQEKVVELVRGEKKTSTRKFFPGYILIQCELDDETWHVVKATPKITGFVGDSRNPVPLAKQEVDNLIQQMEGGAQRPRPKVQFEEGDPVKVIDGPFADFNGTVDEVKPDKGKLRVLISIFGRNTPVELDFVQVEKV